MAVFPPGAALVASAEGQAAKERPVKVQLASQDAGHAPAEGVVFVCLPGVGARTASERFLALSYRRVSPNPPKEWVGSAF